MSTEEAPFLLVLTGRLKLKLAQQLNSSLEAALTEDEVSHFRGVRDYVVQKNFKEKKCNDKFMNVQPYFPLLYFVPWVCMEKIIINEALERGFS